MGALNFFLSSDNVDISAEFQFYLAIPVNLLLCGCQTWVLTKFLTNKLEVFYIRCLRRILKIKWDDGNIISKRRLIFIGMIIRMLCKCVPARLISAFQTNQRPLGRPNITVKYSFINDIENNISNVDLAGTFNSWAHIAFNEKGWKNLVKNLE